MIKPKICASLILAFFSGASSLGSDESQGVLVDGGWFDCLPISTFGLQGLLLSEPEDTIQEVLGEPESISVGWSEDDGGRHDVVTYHYESLEVDAVRGYVDRIYTASNNVSMPSGITPGQTIDEVIAILGRTPKGWKPERTRDHIVTCPVDGEWVQEDYVTLEFDSGKILVSIEYAVSRP